MLRNVLRISPRYQDEAQASELRHLNSPAGVSCWYESGDLFSTRPIIGENAQTARAGSIGQENWHAANGGLREAESDERRTSLSARTDCHATAFFRARKPGQGDAAITEVFARCLLRRSFALQTPAGLRQNENRP